VLTAQLKTAEGKGSSRRLITALMEADPIELVEEGERILFQDNERRLMAGLDVHESPMVATLREQGIGGEWRTIRGRPVLIEPDDNPPAGPPLLPRGRASRWIQLARVRVVDVFQPPNIWVASLGWPDFLSGGLSIPDLHSRGAGRLPIRDQTSRASDTAVRLWKAAIRDWVNDTIRRARGGPT
jgi:hypothetical protein